jgi:integrase
MSLRKVGNYYWIDIRVKGKRFQKQTGIPFHFHLLRYYFASSLVEKRVDFLTVSEILGHSKTMVSLGYTHTDKDRKRRAVELLN